MADKSEWIATDEVAPGFERNRGTGPTASEWTIVNPGGANNPPIDASAYGTMLGTGAVNAAGFGLPNRFTAAKRALTGEEPGYGEALKRLTESQQEFRRENPWAQGAADVTGGVAAGLTGVGLARAGLSLGAGGLQAVGGRLAPYLPNWAKAGLVGGTEGAIIGGLQGAGTTYSGIPSDYIHNAGMGSILGAGMGAVAPAIGAAGGALYRTVADRGFIPGHLAKAAQADAPGLLAVKNTPGAMIPDAGPSMLGVAQGAVTEGPGSTALLTNLKTRDTQSPQRITQHINQDFGPAPVPSFVERDIRARMQAMRPQYEAVLNNASAIDNSQLALTLEGMIGNTKGVTQSKLSEVRRMLDIPTNPGTLDPHPRAMQATREEVRGMRDDPNLPRATREQMSAVYDRLTAELHAKVPGMREVDHAYAELGSQERAIGGDPQSAGRKMFQTGQDAVYRPQELQEVVDAASQPKGVNVGPSAEGLRLQQAARAELERIVGTKKNDLNALEQVLAQPQDWNQQKLAIMFGQERADRLMSVLERERGFRETQQKVGEGSQTARRTSAQKSMEASDSKIPWDLGVTGLVARGGQEAWRAATRASNNTVRDRIAGMFAKQNPVDRNALIDQMLAAQPTRDLRQEIAKRLIRQSIMYGGAAAAPDITNR